MTRLEEIFTSFAAPESGQGAPFALAVSGDLEEDTVARLAEAHFTFGGATGATGIAQPAGDIEVVIDKPKAQAAVGYAAAAAAAGDKASLAMEIALYILSHGYEGRLGKEAISRRGLAYYIDAQYRAGAKGGLVTLAAGVDPGKLDAFRTVMKSEIARLAAEPPTEAEIAEAKRHLNGRKISAAQSNAELADALLRDFIAVGRPESPAALAARLAATSRDDVLDAVADLARGSVVTIRFGGVK